MTRSDLTFWRRYSRPRVWLGRLIMGWGRDLVMGRGWRRRAPLDPEWARALRGPTLGEQIEAIHARESAQEGA